MLKEQRGEKRCKEICLHLHGTFKDYLNHIKSHHVTHWRKDKQQQ